MTFGDLVSISADVASTRSRLKKVTHLSAGLAGLSGREVAIGVSYLSGILPQGKIGVGGAGLAKLRLPTTADKADHVAIADVDHIISDVAECQGAGAQQRKMDLLQGLVDRLSPSEASYLLRLILGELRQGALESIMVDAIAHATAIDVDAVRRAVMVAGDHRPVAVAALAQGESGLAVFDVALFTPLRPMLAQPLSEGSELTPDDFPLAIEPKLDGVRVQVHREGERVAVFTRQMNEVTESVPSVVSLVASFALDSVILDGEVIAERDDGRPHPFQTTMSRFASKTSTRARGAGELSTYFFDCLYLNGESLIDATGAIRRSALEEVIPPAARFARDVIDDWSEGDRIVQRVLASGHEGVMVKSLGAPYMAGSRGAAWRKLKPSHTLDLVVLAAEWGSGRRRGWLSNLHLGARAGDDVVMLGKTFKGLADKTLKWQTEQLLARETHRDKHTVYVRPELVVEIACNEVQQSPRYPAGLALRFMRVKRYRDDKTVTSADTIETVREIFKRQLG
ncbi:MAG: ATP-dependent DNA ligase [Pseudomonadota bacterium]